ncbi:trigger factor [Clavibacter michiganensis subsp. michiganensis]|nr:trigger factor [Clavibacter michiganensis subsp. michiganensis]
MEPNEFVQVLQQNNQIPAMVGEVARNKALAVVLDKAKVVDADGKVVDVTEFTNPVVRDADAVSEEPADADAEAVVADAPAEEAAEAPAAEEAPAEKPKKKAPAKKKASEKAADSE